MGRKFYIVRIEARAFTKPQIAKKDVQPMVLVQRTKYSFAFPFK